MANGDDADRPLPDVSLPVAETYIFRLAKSLVRISANFVGTVGAAEYGVMLGAVIVL